MAGWVLTCRGEDGGDLALTDVTIRRENLVCQVLGGESIFFPVDDGDDAASTSSQAHDDLGLQLTPPEEGGEESILDDIKAMLTQAQSHGCWKAGVGGVGQVRFALLCSRFHFSP